MTFSLCICCSTQTFMKRSEAIVRGEFIYKDRVSQQAVSKYLSQNPQGTNFKETPGPYPRLAESKSPRIKPRTLHS